MTLDTVVPLLFSLIALGCALALTIRRIRRNGFHSMLRRRYVLIDLVVLIAVIEIVLDAIAESIGDGSEAGLVFRWFATVGRGAVTFGVLALLITFPGDDRHVLVGQPPNRRVTDPQGSAEYERQSTS